jgi:hypothetical protein
MAGTLSNTNPLFRPFLTPPDAAPALGNVIAMPSQTPALPAPLAPAVSRVPRESEVLQSKYNDAVNAPDTISGIHNPLVRGIARAGDIAASVFAPRLAQYLPGTTLNHQRQVGIAANNAKMAGEQDKTVADIAQNEAQTARDVTATNLAPQKASDEHSLAQAQIGNYESEVKHRDNPIPKSKTIEEQAYDYAVSQGKNPLDAYSSVYGAKNVKDAGLPQQYLDAIASGDTTKAALIKKVINDTSTAPKIQVIQAAAATKEAAKTAGLDVSDPAMAASVAAVANGSLKLSDVFGRGATTAQKAQFAAAVKAVNPAYNSGDHDIENSARRYMISGQGGQTLNAINTAYHHLDQFDAAARALKNGDSKAINQIANELGVQIQHGASPQVVSDLVKNALKGEIAKAFTGAGATVDEQRNLDSSFSNANSLDTMLGVTKQARALLQGKEKSLKEQFDQGGQGKPNFGALESQPKENDTKTNSHGDKVIFKGGKWGPA